MIFAAKVLLDLSTSSASLPPTKDASIQTDLRCTALDGLLVEANKLKSTELRLSEFVVNLLSKVDEK